MAALVCLLKQLSGFRCVLIRASCRAPRQRLVFVFFSLQFVVCICFSHSRGFCTLIELSFDEEIGAMSTDPGVDLEI
jgi:hypothetical protein